MAIKVNNPSGAAQVPAVVSGIALAITAGFYTSVTTELTSDNPSTSIEDCVFDNSGVITIGDGGVAPSSGSSVLVDSITGGALTIVMGTGGNGTSIVMISNCVIAGNGLSVGSISLAGQHVWTFADIGLDEENVDSILSAIASAGENLSSPALTINGASNAPPSDPGGLASLAAAVAAGWTVTVNPQP